MNRVSSAYLAGIAVFTKVYALSGAPLLLMDLYFEPEIGVPGLPSWQITAAYAIAFCASFVAPIIVSQNLHARFYLWLWPMIPTLLIGIGQVFFGLSPLSYLTAFTGVISLISVAWGLYGAGIKTTDRTEG